MTSLQNQIIKYGKKKNALAQLRIFFFFFVPGKEVDNL